MTAVDEIFELGSALSTKGLTLRRRDRTPGLALPPSRTAGTSGNLGGLRLRLAATINISRARQSAPSILGRTWLV